jgi:rhodanese-related sulfurtransferase
MRSFILSISLFFSVIATAQNSVGELLNQYNNKSIPYISVSTLETIRDTILLLDAREKKEYQISHLQNAVHVGYNHFKIKPFTQQYKSKDTHIVVYCSLGIRSEDISEQLKKAEYTNVYNLYGGIFEWKNKGFPVVNYEEKLTDEVHVYSKKWSKWLHNGTKIYSN